MIRIIHPLVLILTVLTYLPPWVNPDLGLPITTLGLLSPTLWFITLLLAIYWLFKKDRRAWWSGLTLLLGWSMINNVFALPDGGPVPAAEDLIITSLNAHSFPLTGMSDKKAAQEAIFSYLDSLDTDILCMQEYYKESKANAMATRISAKTDLQYSFRGPYGPLIIFSRYPIKNAEAIYFENGVNGFLQVDVQTPKGIVHICNVHLQTNAISEMAHSVAKSPDIRDEDTRETIKTMFTRYGRANRTRTEQSRQILEKLSSVKHPVIVSGDFNEVPTSYLYRLFRTKFQDAHLAQSWGLGTTYGGLIPGLRIDYILPDPSLKVLEFERRPCWFSDHDAVRAVIRQ